MKPSSVACLLFAIFLGAGVLVAENQGNGGQGNNGGQNNGQGGGFGQGVGGGQGHNSQNPPTLPELPVAFQYGAGVALTGMALLTARFRKNKK